MSFTKRAHFSPMMPALSVLLVLAAAPARAGGAQGAPQASANGQNAAPDSSHKPDLAAPNLSTLMAPAKPQPGTADIQWIQIPGGSYEMGADDAGWAAAQPVHRVSVKSFEISKSVVTVKQYRACVKAGACTPIGASDGSCWVWNGKVWAKGTLPQSWQHDDQPAVCADWFQAKAFAEWAGGRLPTEAEWEYAARSGGKDQTYPWGDDQATCDRASMDDGTGNGCGTQAPLPVCSKPKGMTEQGVCDMSGGGWQWTADWFHDDYKGAPTDGSAWVNPPGIMRTGRGGSWNDPEWLQRSAFRNAGYPHDRCAAGGIRVVRSLKS